MGWLIIVGTLPIAGLGLLFKDAIESSLRNLYITAAMLILFALLLWAADRFGAQRRTLKDLGWRHGLLFGLAQALALIPGVSRSGGTITAGLLMGYTREAAARYSFLLAVPAVLASGVYQLWRSAEVGSPVAAGPTALATVVAFGVGYVVIVAFMKSNAGPGAVSENFEPKDVREFETWRQDHYKEHPVNLANGAQIPVL
ncbi:MAG: undecaprenyl-diphosphate phosphatase, partial [Thermoflexus sp.]